MTRVSFIFGAKVSDTVPGFAALQNIPGVQPEELNAGYLIKLAYAHRL